MYKLNGKWLVGISAGSDSLALLDMCYELHMDIIAAHVNYHHRKEAEEEEAYIVNLCKDKDIPLYVLNEPFDYKGNFEAAARKYRYDFFVKLVKELKLKGVLIAHHQDDLLETYVMQEEKGSIPSYYGLKEEMLYQGILVKRPLLDKTKKELIAYCQTHHILYYTDQTNFDESLTRNRIRHQIIEKMNDFERKMLIQEIQKKNAEKQEQACRIQAWMKNEDITLAFYRSLQEEDRIWILRCLISNLDQSMTRSYLHEIDHVLLTKNDFMFPVKDKILVQQDGHFFLHEKVRPYCDVYASHQEILQATNKYYYVTEAHPSVYAISLQEEDFPIKIRSFRDGDEIQMRFGKKKVHRFFIDRHIPKYRRITWPIIENAKGEVIFVSGLGCDIAHYTIKPSFNVVEYFLLNKGEN